MLETIFDYVGKDNDEVSVFSKFISQLLKTKELGQIVLQYFLKSNETIDVINVETEYTINGRHIDILVTSEINANKTIFIFELKVHSDDEQNQIKDYYDWISGNNKNSDVYVIYLTLTGKKPSYVSLPSGHQLWNLKNPNSQRPYLQCYPYTEILRLVEKEVEGLDEDHFGKLKYVFKDFSLNAEKLRLLEDNFSFADRTGIFKLFGEFFLNQDCIQLIDGRKEKASETIKQLSITKTASGSTSTVESFQVGKYFENKDYGLFIEFSKTQNTIGDWTLKYGIAAPENSITHINILAFNAFFNKHIDKTFFASNTSCCPSNVIAANYSTGPNKGIINTKHWLFAQNMNWITPYLLYPEYRRDFYDFFTEDFEELAKIAP